MAVSAQAGGLYVEDFGTPSMATAGAGGVAIAEDASTSAFNPAGMTRLDSHQAMLAVAPGFNIVRFDADNSSPNGDRSGGNQGGFVPLLSSGYVHKLSERWRFGASLFSISGATLDPNNDWAGRTQVTELSLLTLTFQPTLAFRLTDWLSIGAGSAITYAKLDWDLKASLPGGEKFVRIDDADDTAAAAVVGLLVEPSDKVRFGIVYQSKTDLDLSGDLDLPMGITPGLDLELPLAQAVRWDVHWDVNDRLALMVGGNWEDWSDAETVALDVGGRSTNAPLGFRDTWKARIGGHYRLNDKWTLQSGFSYDSSVVKTRDRNAALPLDRQIRVGAGALYDWSEDTRLGFGFQWFNMQNAKLDNAGVKGEYEWNDVFFLSFNVNWKKLPWNDWGTF
jgi:long-chain fatty acid transport protein